MLDMELPCDPAAPLLGAYPREMETYPYRDLHIHVHSSIIHSSPKGKQPAK